MMHDTWFLIHRHPYEIAFEMQITGSKPSLLVPVAEIIGREY